MSTASTNAAALLAPPAGLRPAAASAPAAATTATATQPGAAAGAAQAAAGAQAVGPKPEPFNARPLVLPEGATTRHVLDGLAGAMADPSVNRSTAQRLFEFHQQLLDAEKSMTQAVLEGMR